MAVIAWTVTASGGALSGRVLAPTAGRREPVRAVAGGGGAGGGHRDTRNGAAVYLHARGIRGGVAVSVTATVFDGEEDRR